MRALSLRGAGYEVAEVNTVYWRWEWSLTERSFFSGRREREKAPKPS